MIVAPVLSALHVLALGIGLGSVFMRGRYLRALRAGPEARVLDRLFAADSVWASPPCSGSSPASRARSATSRKRPTSTCAMVLLGQDDALRGRLRAGDWPMMTFIRWPSARRGGRPLPQFDRLSRLVLPFLAAAMARGLWLY